MSKLADDPRIDPRIKALLGDAPVESSTDVASREELLARANTADALAAREVGDALIDALDDEQLAPSAGLDVSTIEYESKPDGNTIKVQVIRPLDADEPLPAVVYLHGGGMQAMSCFNGMYRTWGRMIAHEGVVVAMVDFRNSVYPSTAPEVAPFPAGLNDCVSGIRYVIEHPDEFGVDPGRVVVAGESGGGNLTLASAIQMGRDGDLGSVHGLYALCPYIAGEWPQDRFPSSIENNEIFLDLHDNTHRHAYGIEAFEARDPRAWPSFATEDDVRDFPPTVIHVNECDPLRDEGVEFYRLLVRAGVPARCVQTMGTIHGTEIFAASCPDISRDTAAALARLARDG